MNGCKWELNRRCELCTDLEMILEVYFKISKQFSCKNGTNGRTDYGEAC